MLEELERRDEARLEVAPARAIPFGSTFVKSEAFKELFREGMGLVEQTAGYLDGEGRAQSNKLGRGTALTYASESMRLTTRLMQIASWLLVQRAVAEGEITPVQAQREKERVKLTSQDGGASEAQLVALPEQIRFLVAASLRFHARVVHLDRLIGESIDAVRPSPVTQQQRLLRSIFEIGS